MWAEEPETPEEWMMRKERFDALASIPNERVRAVAVLRSTGMTWDEVAEALGMSLSGAYGYSEYARSLARVHREKEVRPRIGPVFLSGSPSEERRTGEYWRDVKREVARRAEVVARRRGAWRLEVPA